jgi:hypothetical protein
VNIIDNTVEALNISPRIGRQWNLGDFGGLATFVGATYLRADVDIEGSVAFDTSGIPGLGDRTVVDYGIRQQNKDRWNFLVGVGWTAGPRSDRDDPGAIPAGGGGIRYLIARLIGFQVGVDVAASAADTTFYIQAGNTW